ncbi:hypothetical protein [Micromonospora sp. NBC_00617]|uniref:hypothetical protein n=1 Tax=Micromonospora sp. NBC_00617 TaxID=2903587 RepID=UPI0030E0CA83
MLDVRHLDLEEIATALQDQSAYEYRWLIDPASGEIMMWTADGGIDGKTPVDLDELDLFPIDALPSFVWHRDMADFAEQVSDERTGRRLQRAIQGRGAFRRFKDELHEEHPPPRSRRPCPASAACSGRSTRSRSRTTPPPPRCGSSRPPWRP